MQSQVNLESGDASRAKRGRRTYIINPAFQWRYAISIGMVVFFVSMVMSFLLYGALHQQARARLLDKGATVANAMPTVVIFALMLSVVTTASVGIWCLVSSHRVCGPLYVLENYFKDLIAGRLPAPRALRKHDEFKDFYVCFSQAMEALRDDRQRLLNQLTEALTAVQKANGADDAARRRELTTAAVQLDAIRSMVAVSLACESPEAPNDRPNRPRQATPSEPAAVA